MSARYVFGENTRVYASVQDYRLPNDTFREGYVVAELSAGRNKLTLALDPRAAEQLAQQLAAHCRRCRRADRRKALAVLGQGGAP